MNVTVTVRQVYGCPVIYPFDATAKHFAAIAGTKTLTHNALQHIRALGYQINEHREPQLPEALR